MSDNSPPAPNFDKVDAKTDDVYMRTLKSQFRVLDHAPATSHGTYLELTPDGLEPLEDYQDGGYHPVHLGDCLGASGRYRVLHKLGYGGFGTVWLCRDTQDSTYVAVKVLVGDAASDEIPDLTLTQLDKSMPGAEYIAMPLDNFSVDGPNGTHPCVVLPVLGPCASPGLWKRMEEDQGPVFREMAHQAAKALNFLHKNKICHGDFRPSNILVRLANLDHLSEEELLSILGQPQESRVLTESGEDIPTFSPRYLVAPADLSRLGNEYLTDDICVIDFGESFPFASPPEDLGIPEHYLPPELLLEEEDAVGPGCDLWALGCTLFEIREQMPLFYMIHGPDELIAEMVRFFGKLPEEWWEKWSAREEWFDDQGKYIRTRYEEEWSLEVALSKPMQIVESYKDGVSKMKTVLDTPEPEQKLMADLLYKLFQYEPSKRATTDEVLEHEWFKMGTSLVEQKT
ncbi:hypothetical protein AK830_g4414 [Neonectria ditissima]|uniref:EKC/KEOPS complex subunit BUD32 n=1 Tax=Neonectria ditissima TaxID=78410 RepID=A0A0P7B8M6_9HYPO|nr:hypothetical protein AK830_g4414 [Neonectria ditissima]